MTLGYRAVLRLPEDADAVAVAEDQVRSWLRSKLKTEQRPNNALTTADWEGPGRHETGPGAHLTVVRHTGDDGSVRELLRHVEERPDGTWTVSVVAAGLAGVARNAQSLVIELDVGDRDADEAITAGAAPNLVTHVLEAVEVRDGVTDVFAKPVIVRAPEVPHLLRAITDPVRNVAVVVAGMAPGAPVDAWREAVESLLKQSRGVSTGFVLTEAAHHELARLLPDSHAVEAMSIRTFAPQVDLQDPADGLRHRTLSARTMERHLKRTRKGLVVGGYLPQAHARTSRQRFLERPLPADLARTLRILTREEILDRAVALPQPTPGATPELLPRETAEERPAWDGVDRRAHVADVVEIGLAEHARLMRLLAGLGAGELSPDHLSAAEIEVRRLKADALASDAFLDDAAVLEEQRDEAQATAAILELYTADESTARRAAEAEARALRREVEELKRRLRVAEHYDVHVEPEDLDETEPDDVQGIVEVLTPGSGSRLTDFVVFTGDVGKAIEVDGRDTNKRYRGDLWEQVLVLHDFARTKYDGSVYAYLTDPDVTTRKCPTNRFAAGESESVQTNNKLAGQRLLPVPVEVDPSGRVHMFAHFKPPRADMFAPRLHYYDDTKNSGKVYVGYIGKHLGTTTKGN